MSDDLAARVEELERRTKETGAEPEPARQAVLQALERDAGG